ncbi:hypothetical protein HDU99_005878, partial [Rhizoclosmatium hyalinum]
MPEGSIASKIKRIDGLGIITLFASILCLITPLQLGGSIWAWNSGQTIAMFVLFPICFIAFTYVELKVASDPIVPAGMFSNSSVPALLLVAFCVGGGFFTAVYYISLFFQVVNGDSATSAGVQTIPLVFGVVILSIVSGIVVSKTGRYKMFYYIGPVFQAVGAGLIASLTKDSSTVQKIFYLFIFGLGCGSLIQTRILGIQASVPPKFIAVVTAISQTCMTLGGAIGVAVSGTIFNNIISNDIGNYPNLSKAVFDLQSHGIPADPTQ